MSSPKKRVITLKSVIKPSECGLAPEKSNLSQRKEDTEGISYPIQTALKNQTNSKSSTLEFQVKNKKLILKDKPISSEKNSPTIKSSPTLAAVSTSKGKDSNGFWRESSKEISKKLWLPKETASQGLDTHCLNGFLNNTEVTSFVSTPTKTTQNTNSRRTLCLSSRCSALNTTANENTENDLKQICRKIRFYPDKNLKELCQLSCRGTRYLHNKAIEEIRDGKMESYSFQDMRNQIVKKNTDLSEEEKWLEKIPFDTRQLVIKQLASNIKSNITKVKRKQITHFELGFKSKKNPVQTFFVDKRALKPDKFKLFSQKAKTPFCLRKKTKKWWNRNIKSVESDFLVTCKNDKYYLCLPMKKQIPHFNPKETAVALDPGVRTFQTFYSEKSAGKIGDGMCNFLTSKGEKIDELQSILDINDFPKRTRRNLKHRCSLLRTKIKHSVDDLHWKTANYLCRTYKHIFLPEFNVQGMVTKKLPHKARGIGSKTVRNMLSLSHYRFKQRLLYTASVRGNQVHICDEAYTTKTCGGCGVQQYMGGKKVFSCQECSFELDRDFNGSRNIYIKEIGLRMD